MTDDTKSQLRLVSRFGKRAFELAFRALGQIMATGCRLDPRLYAKIMERLAFASFSAPSAPDYITTLSRPKNPVAKAPLPTPAPTAIILQGPVQAGFTVASVQYYRAVFADATIIMSTWNNTPASDIAALEQAGAIVVTSVPPSISGFLNYNFQAISTQAGLVKARQQGAQYVVKSRADQRIYSAEALVFLHALRTRFPANPMLPVKDRLFFMDETSLAHVPFHVCDMLQFGHIDDVARCWDAPLHESNITRTEFDAEYEGQKTIAELVSAPLTRPELYLGRAYAANVLQVGADLNATRDWPRLLRDAIGIVNRNQLDLIWPKYKGLETLRDYNVPHASARLTFEKWLLAMDGTTSLIAHDPKEIL